MFRNAFRVGFPLVVGLSTLSVVRAQEAEGEPQPRPSLTQKFNRMRQSIFGAPAERPAPTAETAEAPASPAVPPTRPAQQSTQTPAPANRYQIPIHAGGNPSTPGSALPGYTPPQMSVTRPVPPLGTPAMRGPSASNPASTPGQPLVRTPRDFPAATAEGGSPFSSRAAEASISDSDGTPPGRSPLETQIPERSEYPTVTTFPSRETAPVTRTIPVGRFDSLLPETRDADVSYPGSRTTYPAARVTPPHEPQSREPQARETPPRETQPSVAAAPAAAPEPAAAPPATPPLSSGYRNYTPRTVSAPFPRSQPSSIAPEPGPTASPVESPVVQSSPAPTVPSVLDTRPRTTRFGESRFDAGPAHTVRSEPIHTPEPRTAVSEPARHQPIQTAAVDRRAPATESDTINLAGQGPVLLVQTAGPRRIVIGKESQFVITLRNTGEAPARDVNVAIKVPEWAEIVSSEAKTIEADSKVAHGSEGVLWTIKRLKGRSDEELTLRIVPRQGTPFELGVTVTHAPLASLATVEVQEPKLAMSLTGPSEVMFAKQEVYKLTLSNPGTGDAENVELKLLPTTPGESAPATHRIGTLKAGENKVVELELTARQGGTLKINAEALASGGLKAVVDEDILVRKAALQVAVTGPRFRYAGTAGKYEMRITNPGNAPAQNVQIMSLIPQGAKFLSSSHRGRSEPEAGKVTWLLSNLEPGSEHLITWQCELAEPGLTRVQVACTADNDLKGTGAFTTEVEAVADLHLSVSDPRGPLPIGEEMTYEVTLQNRGTKSAERVELIGSFADCMEPVSAIGGPKYDVYKGQIRFQPIPLLEPGQQIVLKINAKALRSGNHLFRIELACETLDTRIAAEESTRFYGDDADVTADKAGANKRTRR